MAEPNTAAMVREAQGRRAGVALQLASEALDKRESEIILGVMKSLSKGEPISPDKAVQQWIALSEVRGLRKSLEVIEGKGQRAAKRNAHLRPQIG